MTDEPKKNHWYEMYELECLKTKELEAQIEKMKNQWNCKNNNGHCVSSICPCKDKWELKEK